MNRTAKCQKQIAKGHQLVPPYVWEGMFESLLLWDQTPEQRLVTCNAPILYIGASAPHRDRSGLADLHRFFDVFPSLVTGKVVGSGHYPSLEVPDQVNGMISRFLQIYQNNFKLQT